MPIANHDYLLRDAAPMAAAAAVAAVADTAAAAPDPQEPIDLLGQPKGLTKRHAPTP
jgi:hypothetical protein